MSIFERFEKWSASKAIQDFPTTNTRIIITMCAFIATTFSYLYLLLVGDDSGIDESVFGMWLSFLSLWAGLDIYQKAKKWKTFGNGDESATEPTPDTNRPVPPKPPPQRESHGAVG